MLAAVVIVLASAGVSTVVAVARGTVPAAGAARNSQAGQSAAGALLAQVRRAPSVTQYDSLGAGYVSSPGVSNSGLSGAGVVFTLPSITCISQTDYEYLLPGIWVYDSGGTLTEHVNVNLNCAHGAINEVSAICVQGTCDSSLAVHPGDTIIASLSEAPTGTVGSLVDATAGGFANVVGAATPSDHSVFLGVEGPAAYDLTTVPHFSTIKFTRAELNSAPLGYWSVVAHSLKTQTKVQVAVGAVTDYPYRDTFVTTFKHG